MIRHLLNLLSVSRIPMALLLLAVYRPDSALRAGLALLLVLLIAATDILDGRIARHFGVTTELGYVLDGLGDRAFHVTAYLLLLIGGVLPPLVVWALVFREISQYGVRLAEPDWHASQSSVDRFVTRAFSVAVHMAIVTDLIRVIATQGRPPLPYAVAVTLVLSAVALASYARILPRMVRAWQTAIRG